MYRPIHSEDAPVNQDTIVSVGVHNRAVSLYCNVVEYDVISLTSRHTSLAPPLSSQPSMSSANYVLMTTFPNRELSEPTLTLQQANLLNAVIVQRITSS